MANEKCQMMNGKSLPSRTLLTLFRRFFLAVGFPVELDLAADDFLQGDAGCFVFGGIDVDARPRAALKLFAALRGQYDQPVLGIDLLGLRVFYCFFKFCGWYSHRWPCEPPKSSFRI